MRTTMLMMLALLVGVMYSSASVIYVSGNVSGTWSADTVIVTDEVVVPSGQTLTIAPGVKVLFQTYCKMKVDSAAIIYADGTLYQPILFDDLEDGTYWHGIRFWYASNLSRFTYCHFKHGLAAGDFGSTNTYGGALYCSYSYITVYNCIFDSCAAAQGSAIYLNHSNAQFFRNIVHSNDTQGSSQTGGAGIKCYYANPFIIENLLVNNSTEGTGGGLWCYASNPALESNIFAGNSAASGGAIMASESYISTVRGNVFIGNQADGGGSNPSYGGAIRSSSSELHLDHNCFVNNQATSVQSYGYGGGIWGSNSNLQLLCNSFVGNSATHILNGMGGIAVENNSVLDLKNSILWENEPGQIYNDGSVATVTYSDVQDGWSGTGNIAQLPMFLIPPQFDQRLQWESPCIDAGDPNPIYNDLDGTRGDLGAYFYNQQNPVRIALSPQEIPYLLPADGGDLDFTIHIYNRDHLAHDVTFWCEVILPDGSVRGPLLGPITLAVPPEVLVSRLRTQRIPVTAPLGVCFFKIRGTAAGGLIEDSFMWGKMASSNEGASDWSNYGEDFPYKNDANTNLESEKPQVLLLLGANPNPFNPTTALSYKLQAASRVSIQVYDIAGRLMATLVNGWREAGVHQLTFDGSSLASGIYLAHFEAGSVQQIQKLVLVK